MLSGGAEIVIYFCMFQAAQQWLRSFSTGGLLHTESSGISNQSSPPCWAVALRLRSISTSLEIPLENLPINTSVTKVWSLPAAPKMPGPVIATTGHTIDTIFMPSFLISNLVVYSHMFKATKTKDTSLFGGVVIVWLDPSQYFTP